MTYRISYARDTIEREQRSHWRVSKVEEYHSEQEALRRARDLLDDEEHEAILVSDEAGNTLAGVRLQLRLGFPRE
ncbi:MAG TPA: hypothetical protein VFA12_17675 [Stellaceae bacterium]|nr:hypothetical protein [Stellaceae bacterium]